ncbi:hypothetical protein EV189_1384 [Motilibacter rhizosphaerae]|uniref:Uncharacterized protein n=1 Tax=Motilibacter rhizosphaerae TaxID=598652 RepID=A0A4Q7NRC1_9ACTN|nr:hypothetical protein [Motilibacter rhizosphaerae]RZS89616.1 hypothetical protein EV189_1384 [Motilibacter rhizosphaerae]
MDLPTRPVLLRRAGAAGAVLIAAAALGPVRAAVAGEAQTTLRGTVVGSLPSDPLLHGIHPGGAPWAGTGRATLDRSGALEVRVRGLLLTAGAAAGTIGSVTTVSASVLCGADSTAPVATTAAVPLSARGDARLTAHVDLPARCLAPTVVVHPLANTTAYIAAVAVGG